MRRPLRLSLALALAATTALATGCGDDGPSDLLGTGDASTGEDTGTDDATPPGDAGDDPSGDATGGDAGATDAGGEDADPRDGGTTDTGGDDTHVGPDAGVEVTWHSHARAIVETHCIDCHSSGGVGPFALDSWAAAEPYAASIVASTVAGRMPPWPPDADCHPMAHERRLDEAELAALTAWQAGGFAEGDPSTYQAPDTRDRVELGAPDLSLAPDADYEADPRQPDDYRCLPLSHTFETETLIRAVDILPGQRSVVHHVLLYEVGPGDVARMEQLDADDNGPGYACFGGPRAGNGRTLAGWVPGSEPMVFGDGAALRIPAGSRIVMQVHYNSLGLDPATIPPDRTRAALWFLDPDDLTAEVNILGIADTSIFIEAGDPASVHERTWPVPFGADIIGVAPHMHTLGSRISVSLERGDGTDACLVNIPTWDFDWQRFYAYPDDQPVPVRPGDQIRMTCEYDNSPGNQPIVNGDRLDPRDVRWGDGTLDEMCLNYLIVATPAYPDDGGTCGTFEPCVRACDDGDGQCFLGCMFDADGCGSCMADAIQPCITDHCGAAALPFFACFSGCDNDLTCVLDACTDELDALWTCLEPHVESGACDDDFAVCDVSFAER